MTAWTRRSWPPGTLVAVRTHRGLRAAHRRLPSPVFLALVLVAGLGAALLALGTGQTVLRAGAVLTVVGGWAVSLCLHELGHAVVALRGGDTSVRDKGYLTLDPRRYVDPMLSIGLPLLLLAVGGIPLPGGAVWIERHRLRSRWVDSAVSLAGPLVNLVLAVGLTMVVSCTTMPLPLAAVLSWLALVQVLAFLLNLLPVPGLDGWGVLDPHLSASARRTAAQVRPFAPLLLFAVLISSNRVAGVLFSVADAVFGALGGSTGLAAVGQGLFLFWR